MAVRGVVTTLTFYAEDYGPATAPLYRYQNHFDTTYTINGAAYAYNSFEISTLTNEKDGTLKDTTINFVGTAANVDLVETAIQNRYVVDIQIFRWSTNIDVPPVFNLIGATGGNVLSGSSDFSTVTAVVNRYSTSLNTDLPWRKIPWTILGPLSFRR